MCFFLAAVFNYEYYRQHIKIPRDQTDILLIKNCVLSHRYFYGPIEGTQYSLGLALPEKYGLHELISQQEIRHSHINGKFKIKSTIIHYSI